MDTSSKVLALAFGEGDRVVWEENRGDTIRHLENCMPLVQKGLKNVGWTVKDIDVIACGVGPGSFTGLRIGLAAAKALAIAGKTKLVGVSSLDAIAQFQEPSHDCAVVLDARRGKVYAAFYAHRAGKLVKKGSDALISVKQLKSRIMRRKKPILLYGDAINVYQNELRAMGKKKVLLSPPEDWYPCGRGIVYCAHECIKNNEYLDVSQLLPQYLRPSYAEELKKK